MLPEISIVGFIEMAGFFQFQSRNLKFESGYGKETKKEK